MTEPNRGNDRRMASRHTESLSDIRNAGSDRTTAITLFHKEKDLSLHEGGKKSKTKIDSCQSCVAMLGAGLWSHVVLCSCVS